MSPISQRDLPAHVVVYYVIALALYMQSSYREVLRCLLEGIQWLAGPSALTVLQLRSGKLGPVVSPEEAAAYPFTDQERAIVAQTTAEHIVGSPDTVYRGLVALAERTGADELMLSTRAHSFATRSRSLSLVAGRWGMVPAAA